MGFITKNWGKVSETDHEERLAKMNNRLQKLQNEKTEAFEKLKNHAEREKVDRDGKLIPHIMFEYGKGIYQADHGDIGFTEVMHHFKEYRVVSVIQEDAYSGGKCYKVFMELRPEMERFYEAI